MSSAAVSPARTSASPVKGPVSRACDPAFGATTHDSLARYDHASLSWKTSQRCALGDWQEFSGSWPRSGTTRSGIAYPLPTLAPLIAETESGLLPTPTATSYGTNRGGAAGRVGSIRPSLQYMARHNLWPTPTRVTNTGGAALCKWGGAGSRKKLRKMVTPVEFNGALNPVWVEWLMGFPLGWTDLGRSETHSSRKSRK